MKHVLWVSIWQDQVYGIGWQALALDTGAKSMYEVMNEDIYLFVPQ